MGDTVLVIYLITAGAMLLVVIGGAAAWRVWSPMLRARRRVAEMRASAGRAPARELERAA